MGKLATSSGSNGKGSKSIFFKKKEKFGLKRAAKRALVDKSPAQKTTKAYTKDQKHRKLTKSRSPSANKGHKQLEDADLDTEKDTDMGDNVNSSDDKSEESASENMSDGSDADGNNVETDADQDDDDDEDDEEDDDDDDDDDDDAPTDIEEPEIEDRGKTFRAKRPRPDHGRRKLVDSKRKNYAEPEPSLSKVDGINLTRKKQEELFRLWLESHSHREQYFIGDDWYIYPNPANMKKFIEAFKNIEVSSQSVSLPFAPMSKVIASNPRIVIGVSGVRHIQRAAGLRVWPVFYVSKDQYNDNNKSHSTKIIRMNFPLHKLDDIAAGMLELCQGLNFPVNANLGGK